MENKMPSTFPCPKCGEYHYHKSHSKSTYEKARKKLLRQRVYRCHRCGYRSWERKKSISSTLTPRMKMFYGIALILAILVGFLCKFFII